MSHTVGNILRSRSVGALALQDVKGKMPISSSTNLRNRLGNLSDAVKTIIVPFIANTPQLLSYQTAREPRWLYCAPSYRTPYK